MCGVLWVSRCVPPLSFPFPVLIPVVILCLSRWRPVGAHCRSFFSQTPEFPSSGNQDAGMGEKPVHQNLIPRCSYDVARVRFGNWKVSGTTTLDTHRRYKLPDNCFQKLGIKLCFFLTSSVKEEYLTAKQGVLTISALLMIRWVHWVNNYWSISTWFAGGFTIINERLC